MKLKRIIALVVLCFMMVSVAAGCGGSKKEPTVQENTTVVSNSAGTQSSSSGTEDQTPKPKRKRTYTVYNGDTSALVTDFSQTPVGKKIEELTGVTLKIEYIVGQDQKTKAGVMIASGDYPDIIIGHNETYAFAQAGALIPLNDYIEKYGDNIKKWYTETEIKSHIFPGTDKIYFLTNSRQLAPTLYGSSAFWLPIAVLDELGYPMVTEFEQYFSIIEDYVKRNPEYNGKKTIGYTAITDGWRIFTLRNAHCFLAGYPNDGDFSFVDRETNVSTDCTTAPSAKRYYQKLNDFWNKGLMDEEMFTQTYDMYLQKIIEGRVIGFYDQRWQFESAIQVMDRRLNIQDRIHVPMPVLYEDVPRENEHMLEAITMDPTRGVGISKTCKDPEGVFEFLNDMMSEEALKLIIWGIEGVHHSVDADGRMYLNEEQLLNIDDRQYCIENGLLGRNTPFFRPAKTPETVFSDGNPVYYEFTKEYLADKYRPYEKEYLAKYNKKSFVEFFNPPIVSKIDQAYSVTFPENHPGLIARNELDDYTRRELPRLITCKPSEFEAVWEQFCKGASRINIQAYHDFRTQVFKERAARYEQ